MQKSTVVHSRISPEVKNECDAIFTKLGITTSYAITLFLNQVAIEKGIPFKIKLPNEDVVKFADNLSSVDSDTKLSDKAKAIIELYAGDYISFETASEAIKKLHEKDE